MTFYSPTALCLVFILSTSSALADLELVEKDPFDGENDVLKPPSILSYPDTVSPYELEAYYYGIYGDLVNEDVGTYGRFGNYTSTDSCTHVRDVPEDFRSPRFMRPRGISVFYQKYTEAYNIPVLASIAVPDAALRRACYVLRFLLADRLDIRQRFFKSYGRVAIMAPSEKVTDIPEYHFLSDVYNRGSRGLGAIDMAPVSSVGVENILCYHNDSFRREDILVRQISHGIHHIAAKHVIPNFSAGLNRLYERAMLSGWWKETYASLSADAYFGEGIQSYFNVNGYSRHTDGVHNRINTRAKLRGYDPELYFFIEQLFPCGNNYLKRCGRRGTEKYQKLQMDCPAFNWSPV